MKKFIVLSVDDEESIRDAFVLALEDFSDVEVISAVNGRIGVEMSKKHNPDLIFMDLKMPEMDGVTAIREIRRTNKRSPIYVVTAFAKEFFEDLDLLNQDNIDYELASKPLSIKQIRDIVNLHLQHLRSK